MTQLNGLTSGFHIIDIEKFCRDNYEHIKNKQEKWKGINFDYSDGIKDILREILDTYFGGI